MAAKNYNSFPEAAEVMIRTDGSVELIRTRQTLDQMVVNEVMPGAADPVSGAC
jgi:diaminopimelate decarboxylase